MFQAGLSVREVLPVPRGYPSVPPQPRSTLPGLQAHLPLGPWFPAPAWLLPQLPGLCSMPSAEQVS